MKRTGVALGAVLVLCLALSDPVAAQPAPVPEATPDPFVLLGQGPWPGMTAWDVAWCKELVWEARVVEYRVPGEKPRLVWLKDVRGWKKPNGFYGLKINGEAVDEATVWLAYAGQMTNLRVLFTYGSAPVRDVSPFRD